MGDNEKDRGAVDGRDYARRVGKSHDAIATFGDVLGLLEYFGVIPSPAENAPTPHTDEAAYNDAMETADAPAAVSAGAAPAAPAAAPARPRRPKKPARARR